jgi:hypothetical protein
VVGVEINSRSSGKTTFLGIYTSANGIFFFFLRVDGQLADSFSTNSQVERNFKGIVDVSSRFCGIIIYFIYFGHFLLFGMLKLPPMPTPRELVRLYRLSAVKELSQNFILDLNVTGPHPVQQSFNL